jgi:hypothetical protein
MPCTEHFPLGTWTIPDGWQLCSGLQSVRDGWFTGWRDLTTDLVLAGYASPAYNPPRSDQASGRIVPPGHTFGKPFAVPVGQDGIGPPVDLRTRVVGAPSGQPYHHAVVKDIAVRWAPYTTIPTTLWRTPPLQQRQRLGALDAHAFAARKRNTRQSSLRQRGPL